MENSWKSYYIINCVIKPKNSPFLYFTHATLLWEQSVIKNLNGFKMYKSL